MLVITGNCPSDSEWLVRNSSLTPCPAASVPTLLDGLSAVLRWRRRLAWGCV